MEGHDLSPVTETSTGLVVVRVPVIATPGIHYDILRFGHGSLDAIIGAAASTLGIILWPGHVIPSRQTKPQVI